MSYYLTETQYHFSSAHNREVSQNYSQIRLKWKVFRVCVEVEVSYEYCMIKCHAAVSSSLVTDENYSCPESA